MTKNNLQINSQLASTGAWLIRLNNVQINSCNILINGTAFTLHSSARNAWQNLACSPPNITVNNSGPMSGTAVDVI